MTEAEDNQDQAPECVSRLACEEDLPVLAIFERELARLSFPEDPILDLDYHMEKLRRALRQEPDGMIVQTVTTEDAPTGDEIAGWLWLSTKRTLATSEQYGVLRSIYVRRSYRRHGLALSLAEYALRYFGQRGISRIVAKIHAGNQPAMQVLRRMGFEPLHTTLEYRSEPGNRRRFEEDDLDDEQ